MKIFRWWGLLTFFGITCLIALGSYFYIPVLVKSSIEGLGSEVLGAKVEVKRIDLTLSPIGLTLNGLTGANPDEPMKNLFDVEQVKVALDFESLLWKKVVIEDLNLVGIKTGTERKTSGELEEGRLTEQVASKVVEMSVPEISKEDIKTMVENADLETSKRIETFKQTQQNVEQQWNTDLDKQSSQDRIDALQAEYNRLSDRLKQDKLNLIKDKKDWKQLNRNVKEEKNRISGLSSKLKQDKANLKSLYEGVKQGPSDDLEHLMSEIGFSNGVEGMVDQYIGPQYTQWVMQGLEYAKQFKPSDSQTTSEEEPEETLEIGQPVRFGDKHTGADFLIRSMLISGSESNEQGVNTDLSGEGFDIGYLPWLTGKPAKINFKMDGSKKASFQINSAWKNKNEMMTDLKANIDQWPVSNMAFLKSKEGQWQLTSGIFMADLKGTLTLEKIDLMADLFIQKPVLTAPEKLPDWQIALVNKINQQNQIKFTLKASGKISSPKVSVKSDIEKLFKQAIGDKIKQKSEQIKLQLKQMIEQKIGNLEQLNNFEQKLDSYQAQLKDKDKLLEGLLGKIKI
ncbi:MAG: TIGR03545 family protein [Gammaproteobacteria bacterium]|nr:TIGR03545 family protein [Gammaproteobacteria bacterium]